MARDDGTPGVEFNAGPDDGDAEEELPEHARRRFGTSQRWTLAGGGAVLVAAALLTRGLSHSNSPQAASSTPSSPSSSASSASSSAAIGTPDPASSVLARESFGPAVPLPEGNRTAQDQCGTQSGCSIARTLPREAVQAINARFAGAVVDNTTSVIGPSANRIAPQLIARAVGVNAEGVLVTIQISLSGPRDKETHSLVRGPSNTTSVLHLTQGYTVVIRAVHRGAAVPVATLAKLAADVGLLVPE